MENIDIVEFVENMCHVELLEYQKELIRKIHNAGPDAKILYPRHAGYTHYKHLAEMCRMLFLEDRNET